MSAPLCENVEVLLPTAQGATRTNVVPQAVYRLLVIQIPCLNEAATLPATLAALPRQVEGFSRVVWLVIDDGSTDGTAEVARAHGVDHVVRLGQNRGLARAFITGLEQALLLGADVIVNTDADNQYNADDIPALVRPILEGRAQIVIGERPIASIESFSTTKKLLQRMGSRTVSLFSGTRIGDAPSGFRAIHRDAALVLNVFTHYTYTLETIIQAGRRGIPITSVPIHVNTVTRPSRLISSIPRYVYRSILTIIRVFVIYKPLRFFLFLALLAGIPATIFICRFLFFYAIGEGQGHVQSLVLSTALLVAASSFGVAGIVADLLATNRIMLEDLRRRQLLAEVRDALRECKGDR
ncbi:MAG: glycosyltransferase family 2 protein [Geminicoccaceae bacterium]